MGYQVQSKIISASEGVYIDDYRATRVSDKFPVDLTVTVTVANPLYVPPANPDEPPAQPPFISVTVDIHGLGEISSGAEGVYIDSHPAARLGDAVKCDFVVTGSVTPPSDPGSAPSDPIGFTLHVTGEGTIVDVAGDGIIEGKRVARIDDPVELMVEVSIG